VSTRSPMSTSGRVSSERYRSVVVAIGGAKLTKGLGYGAQMGRIVPGWTKMLGGHELIEHVIAS